LRGVDHGESSVNQAPAVEHSPQGIRTWPVKPDAWCLLLVREVE
jgi:hypothetical protein